MSTQSLKNPALRNFRPTPVYGGVSEELTSVLTKAGGLLLLVLLAAGATVALCPKSLLGLVTMGAGIVTLVLGLVMGFTRRASLPLLFLFVLLDGVVVGGASYLYESLYHGVVPLALAATTCTALAIVGGQAAGFLRTTPGMVKFVAYATLGYMVFWLVTLVAGLMGFHFLTLGSPISIAVSVIGTFLATYSFLRDVEGVSQAARNGVAPRDAWYLAFSLTVTLVWLYMELLRLITNLEAFSRD